MYSSRCFTFFGNLFSPFSTKLLFTPVNQHTIQRFSFDALLAGCAGRMTSVKKLLLPFQHQMLRQTIYHKGLIISLDQRLDVIQEICSHIISFLVHPVPGNQLFVVGNLMYIVDAGRTHLRIIGYPVDYYHLSRISLICRFHRSTAYHKGFINIHPGCHVGSASLQRGKLHASGLAANLIL